MLRAVHFLLLAAVCVAEESPKPKVSAKLEADYLALHVKATITNATQGLEQFPNQMLLLLELLLLLAHRR